MTNTLRHILLWAKAQLKAIDSGNLDAEILVAHALQISRPQLYIKLSESINAETQASIEQLMQRRASGEPIAYIVGYREFWSLNLQVTPATLIPRPETECLVEATLSLLPKDECCHVADLGTGSGAIALALASERPGWSIVATDKILAALKVAQDNARLLKVHNVQFYQGNWCEPLDKQRFDAIISNPPYIDKNDKSWCETVKLYEPATALIAEEAGLADIRDIIEQAQPYLKPGGWLLLEHGYNQAAIVKQLLIQNGYKNIQTKHDLAHISRVAVAQFK